MFKSIRWQLPLSYAAIALLAALALGVVLLTTLRSYYLGQELAYLASNAQGISPEMARMVQVNLPLKAVQAQLENFSFLYQARVRLLDPDRQPLADSGEPAERPQIAALSIGVDESVSVPADAFNRPFMKALTGSIPGKEYASFIYIQRPGLDIIPTDNLVTRTLVISKPYGEFHKVEIGKTVTGTEVITVETITGAVKVAKFIEELPPPPDFISVMPAVSAPYGFRLSAKALPSDGSRSDQVISQPFYDPEGNLLGYAELSQGPAYGREILTSVAWGWVLASSVAVILAAGVGWLISRRLSAPLLALTEVTGRMAQGHLAVRANITTPAPSEVKQLAGAFNEMAEQVEQTVQTLRRFVADAAHELHTPLTALRTNLELTASSDDEAGRRDFMARAQNQVERLEKLTRDLLDLSRLETGAVETHYVTVDLAALAQELGELYASQAEQAGLNFSLELPEGAVPVRGNQVQLRRALSNLLDNALKFTPAGGTVRLGLRQVDRWVEVWLEDTGIGIPPGDLPQLFSRFHRGRNAADYPGSGLGLSIVKAIIEGHGGQVTASNTPHGACFRLRLPQE